MGWQRLDKLDPQEQIAQWENGQVSFVPMQHLNCYSVVNEPLTSIRGTGIYSLMTSNHRIPFYLDSGGPLHIEEVQNLPRRGAIPVTGQLNGQEIWSPSLQLAIAIQADATITPWATIFNLKKPRKIERLKEISLALGLTPREATYGEVARITFHNHEIAASLEWLGPQKQFDVARMLQLTPAAKEHVLAEVVLWDGTSSASSQAASKGNRKAYFTTNYHNAVAVQTIAHTCNRQGLLNILYYKGANGQTESYYVVSLNRRQFAQIECLTIDRATNSITGRVYCPTVPSGLFLVRAGNRISVTGNSNYLGTPARMVDANPETFPTRKVAKELQDLYFDVCPGVKKWQEHTVQLAAKQGYLRNPFGYIHRFWNVLNWRKERDGEWHSSFGEDAKRAVAFNPQSTAAGIIKDAMLELDRIGLSHYLRLQVHDSLVLEIPEESIPQVLTAVATVMATPNTHLPLDPAWGLGNYLGIEVESKVGPSWGEMK
jgi:hypothetical protein